MASSQPNPTKSCSSLFSISRTILLLPPPLLPSCPSTVTSCLGYCSCLRTGLPASFCDHLLNLFPPSSQRHLSTLLVRWHFSSVQTLPETASLLLSLSTRAPFPMSMLPPPLSQFFLFQPHRPPRCSLDVPSMLPPQDICTCFLLCLGCSSLRYLYDSCLAPFGCLLSYHLLSQCFPSCLSKISFPISITFYPSAHFFLSIPDYNLKYTFIYLFLLSHPTRVSAPQSREFDSFSAELLGCRTHLGLQYAWNECKLSKRVNEQMDGMEEGIYTYI